MASKFEEKPKKKGKNEILVSFVKYLKKNHLPLRPSLKRYLKKKK